MQSNDTPLVIAPTTPKVTLKERLTQRKVLIGLGIGAALAAAAAVIVKANADDDYSAEDDLMAVADAVGVTEHDIPA